MSKKVIITGGCGFLGSHICELFHNQKWIVESVDNLTKYELNRTGFDVELARNHNLDFLKSLNIKNHHSDIREYDELLNICKGADYIIHTAAQPAITLSAEDPFYDMSVNIQGTLNVLQIAKELNIPVAICSTVHVYGNTINEKLSEEETRFVLKDYEITESESLLQGNLTPLHVSKGAGDLYTQAYINTYNLTAAVFRLTGIYGPRQFGGEDHGWVANFVIRNNNSKEINIYGTGKQVRDILYVKDAAQAFLDFYYNQTSGVYNLSGGEKCSISLLECIDLIKEISSQKVQVSHKEKRIGDLNYFVCECKKAKDNIKWAPKTLPKEGVTHLYDWVKENSNIFK